MNLVANQNVVVIIQVIFFGVTTAKGLYKKIQVPLTSVQLSERTSSPSIVIQLKNELSKDSTLTKPEEWIISGKRTSGLPSVIYRDSKEHIVFENTKFWKSEVSGIIAYQLHQREHSDSLKLAVFFTVPAPSIFRYTSNWFGIRLIPSDSPVNKNLYDTTKNYLHKINQHTFQNSHALLAFIPDSDRIACNNFKHLIHDAYEIEKKVKEEGDTGLCNARCVTIIVLGDIGRSPRMRYHAESLSREGAFVHMIGYCSSVPIPESLAKDPAVRVHSMAEPPAFLTYIPRLLALPLKLAWQAVFLSWALLWMVLRYQFRPDAILVQNPPALPTLPVVWAWASVLWADFVIDWHNYAHTLMAISAKKGDGSSGNRNPVVKFAKLLEEYFGKKADKHMCVTRAMKDDLKARLNIDAVTLYDRPPQKFQPMTDSEKKEFLQRFGTDLNIPEVTAIAENLDNPARTRILVSSTSWTEDEDFSILLRALQDYEVASKDESSMYPPLIVFITGKGPLKSYYQDLISKMDFTRVIIHLPWLADGDYPKLLGSADLGISLHYSSSGLDLPMKVVDMFGCALPVCAVDFQCLGELVVNGQNSQVFQDSTELAEQIQSWFRIQPGKKNILHQKFRKALEEWGRIRWHENWMLHAQPLFSY